MAILQASSRRSESVPLFVAKGDIFLDITQNVSRPYKRPTTAESGTGWHSRWAAEAYKPIPSQGKTSQYGPLTSAFKQADRGVLHHDAGHLTNGIARACRRPMPVTTFQREAAGSGYRHAGSCWLPSSIQPRQFFLRGFRAMIQPRRVCGLAACRRDGPPVLGPTASAQRLAGIHNVV